VFHRNACHRVRSFCFLISESGNCIGIAGGISWMFKSILQILTIDWGQIVTSWLLFRTPQMTAQMTAAQENWGIIMKKSTQFLQNFDFLILTAFRLHLNCRTVPCKVELFFHDFKSKTGQFVSWTAIPSMTWDCIWIARHSSFVEFLIVGSPAFELQLASPKGDLTA